MESIEARLYMALQERLKAQVPAIAWIDIDLGQLEAYDGMKPPVIWPCALVDFTQTDFQQMQGYQRGAFQLQIRLGFDQYEQTHSDVPEYVLQQGLTYYELEHQLHKALQKHNIGGLLTDSLRRVTKKVETRKDDNYRVVNITYSGVYDDSTTSL